MKFWMRLICLMTVLAPMVAGGANSSDQLKGKGGPIQIVSDRLDAYNEKKLVIFSGNVIATQEDKVINCDTLYIYYKDKDDAAKSPHSETAKSSAASTSDIDRIEAIGRVKVTQTNRVVTGEKAVFLQDDQKIIVTGNPVMREDENVIKGERIIVLLDQNKGIVESSNTKRVTAIINTEDKGKKK